MALKGLIIREPWISEILSGRKTWELRSTTYSHRGEIALIRQGSGLIVGIAKLVDCLPKLDAEAMRKTEREHRVPPEGQADAIARDWVVPWVLTEARALNTPVKYNHPSGAVKTVNLDEQTEMAVRQQLGQRPRTAAASPRLASEVGLERGCAQPVRSQSVVARVRQRDELPHIGGKSVNSITDENVHLLRASPPAPVPADLEQVAISPMPIAAARTISFDGMREWFEIARILIGVGTMLFGIGCGVIWFWTLMTDGILPALLAWTGIRWILWAMISAAVVGVTIGDIVGEAQPPSTSFRRRKRR